MGKVMAEAKSVIKFSAWVFKMFMTTTNNENISWFACY